MGEYAEDDFTYDDFPEQPRNNGMRTVRDPMELTSEHTESWRQRYDTLGSSITRLGHRKTFELNAAGNFLVKDYRPATILVIYSGGDEAEAIRAYNEA